MQNRTFMQDRRKKYKREDLILRDHLAIDRTTLANERTMLAYIRTSITAFIGGASFIKFFDSLMLTIIGWIFIPLGIFTLFIGMLRYRQMKTSIPRFYHIVDDEIIQSPIHEKSVG